MSAKNCREGRSRFLKKDSTARVRDASPHQNQAQIGFQSGTGKVERPTESEESSQNGREIEQGLFLGDNNVIIVQIKYLLNFCQSS